MNAFLFALILVGLGWIVVLAVKNPGVTAGIGKLFMSVLKK